MRKVIALVIASLALVGMVSAYSYAYVMNTDKLTVSSTNSALVALIPTTGVGYKDGTAQVVGNDLVIDFGVNGGGSHPGLQPNSRYDWDNLFEVKNNSSDTVKFRINLDTWSGSVGQFVNSIAAYTPGGDQYTGTEFKGTSNWYVLQPAGTSGDTASIYVRLGIPDGTVPNSFNGQFQVESYAQ